MTERRGVELERYEKGKGEIWREGEIEREKGRDRVEEVGGKEKDIL